MKTVDWKLHLKRHKVKKKTKKTAVQIGHGGSFHFTQVLLGSVVVLVAVSSDVPRVLVRAIVAERAATFVLCVVN